MNSIKKNVIYQIVFRILTIITPLITSPIISRAFGAEGIGLYSATYTYVTYFTLFAMLGVENYGNRSIAAVQGNIKERSILFWNIYIVQFTSSVIAICAYLFSFIWIDSSRIILATVQGVWILSFLFDINWFYFGIEQFKITVIRSSIIKIITVILIAVLIHKPEDLLLYALIMSVGALTSQLVLWFCIPRYVVFIKPSLKNCTSHIKPIIKLYIPIIAISIFRLMDKSMLDILSNEENLGYYYNSDKIVNIPLGLVTAVSTVMLPRISNMLHNNKNVNSIKGVLEKSSELTILLVCAVSFGIATIAKEFVPLFFGDGYEPCVRLIYFFVPVLIIKALENIVCSQYLIPAHKDNIYIGALFGGAIANIVSNYFLIKQFHALGAVLGTLVAELVVLFIQLFYVREINFIKIYIRNIQYVIFGFVMFASGRLLSVIIHVNDYIKVAVMILIGGCVYLILCVIFGSINKQSLIYAEIQRHLSKRSKA